MEDLKSELAIIFCNQAKLTVVGLEHQPSPTPLAPNLFHPEGMLGQQWLRICGSHQPITGLTCVGAKK